MQKKLPDLVVGEQPGPVGAAQEEGRRVTTLYSLVEGAAPQAPNGPVLPVHEAVRRARDLSCVEFLMRLGRA